MSGAAPSGHRRGLAAEALAAWALRFKGWRIVGRRVKPPRGSGAGEIDLVARRGRVLAFVEIKARPSEAEGLFAIAPRQQRRLLRAAEWFIKCHPEFSGHDLRFDAMVVCPGRWPRHHPDAWRAET